MVKVKNKVIESIIHLVFFMLIWGVIANIILMNLENIYVLIPISILGILYLIFYIKKPYKKEKLRINSWILLMIAIFSGITIGKFLKLETIVVVIIAVSICDILSFMKIGKKTANAKVMANSNLKNKLIVYGISLKGKRLVPTKGIGDFFFYTMVLSGIYKSFNYIMALNTSLVIFIGCLINCFIVCFTYDKKGYKGFPAIPIPLGLVLAMIIFLTI